MKSLVKEASAYISDINGNVGDLWAWSFEGGAEILKVTVGVLGDDAGGATIAFNKLEGGTLTDGAVGEITIPAADTQGQTLVEEVPRSAGRIAAGGSVIVDCTSEDVTSLAIVVKIEYKDLGEYNANSDSVDSA